MDDFYLFTSIFSEDIIILANTILSWQVVFEIMTSMGLRRCVVESAGRLVLKVGLNDIPQPYQGRNITIDNGYTLRGRI